MPSRLIQTQHVQITPMLHWQSRDEQDPSSHIERLGPHAILLLTCRSLGAPLGFLALLFRGPQAKAAYAKSIHFVVDTELSAKKIAPFGLDPLPPPTPLVGLDCPVSHTSCTSIE